MTMSYTYTRCPNDLLRHTALKPLEKLAWLLIASNVPGFALQRDDAAAMLGISRNTWCKTVRSLLDKNMISCEWSSKGNIYTVNNCVSTWKITDEPHQKLVRPPVPKIGSASAPKIGTPPVPKIGSALYIKEKIKEKENTSLRDESAHTHARTREGGLVEEVFAHQALIENFAMANAITVEQARAWAQEIVNEWRIAGITHIDNADAKRHLLSTIRIRAEIKRKENAKSNNDRPTAAQRAADAQRHIAALMAQNHAAAQRVQDM